MIGGLFAKFWGYLVAAAAIGVLGWYLVQTIEGKALAEADLAAEKALRKTERKQHKEASDAVQKQVDDMAAVNAALNADLEQLRTRPARIVEAARTDCQGATGAELSGPDAGFLTREAARADTLRAALVACYAYADGLQ